MPIQVYTHYFTTDTIVIEAHEHYQKRSFRNKTAISSPNGCQYLSVPLSKGKHHQTKIRSIKIANDVNWRLQHKKAIINNYKASPFLRYYPQLIQILDREHFSLFDMNLEIHQQILEILDLNEKMIHFTHDYDPNNNYSLNIKDTIYKGNMMYPQVFDSKNGFIEGLSILDLIFNLGPESSLYLKRLSLTS